jgi:hypothetical protein
MVSMNNRSLCLVTSLAASAFTLALPRQASAWTTHPAVGGAGCALSIAAGAAMGSNSGDVWITGCTVGGPGGEDIFVSNSGGPWTLQQSTQQGVEIATDANESLSLIDASGNIFFFGDPNGTGTNTWQSMAGCATSITQSNDIFNMLITGCTQQSSGGDGIYSGNPSDPMPDPWIQLGGQATQIASDDNGDVWIVNAHGNIYQFSGDNQYDGSWTSVPGCATSISVNASTNVWIVGCTQTGAKGNGLYSGAFNGSSWVWTEVPGSQAWKVSVDAAGNPWTLENDGTIWFWTNP